VQVLGDFGRIDTIHGFSTKQGFHSMAGCFCPSVKSKIEQVLLVRVDWKFSLKKK
jgi:hypothetical protein